jgi:hypothetical protein
VRWRWWLFVPWVVLRVHVGCAHVLGQPGNDLLARGRADKARGQQVLAPDHPRNGVEELQLVSQVQTVRVGHGVRDHLANKCLR